jgi:hypothetical protein
MGSATAKYLGSIAVIGSILHKSLGERRPRRASDPSPRSPPCFLARLLIDLQAERQPRGPQPLRRADLSPLRLAPEGVCQCASHSLVSVSGMEHIDRK